MKYHKIKFLLLVLLVALSVLVVEIALAAETGYVVGRVYIELDGYEGMHAFLAEEANIELVHVFKDGEGNWQEKFYKTRCDEEGYYYLSKMPLDGYYRVTKFIQDGGTEIPSWIPPTIKGILDNIDLILLRFSGSRIAEHLDIIDVGETIIVLHEGGTLSLVQKSGTGISTITKEGKNSWEGSNFGFSVLGYFSKFSKNASGILKETASKALEDRTKYLKAVPFHDQAYELTKSDKDAAVEKYRAAIQAYPAYDDAYFNLAVVLIDLQKEEEAIQLLKQGQEHCPTSNKIKFVLGSLYAKTGQAANAIPLLEDVLDVLSNKNNERLAYLYLARAYIKAGRVSEAVQISKICNKSFVYYNIYFTLKAAVQFDQAEQMINKAMATYADGTLSIKQSKLKDIITNFSINKKAQEHFIAYLKTIQEDGDYENWEGKPYDLHIERNSIKKKLTHNPVITIEEDEEGQENEVKNKLKELLKELQEND